LGTLDFVNHSFILESHDHSLVCVDFVSFGLRSESALLERGSYGTELTTTGPLWGPPGLPSDIVARMRLNVSRGT